MIKSLLPIFLFLILLGEIYTVHLLFKFTQKKQVAYAYIVLLIAIIIGVFLFFSGIDRSKGQTAVSMYILSFLLFFLLPKIIFSIILFMEDLFRFSKWISNKYIIKKTIENKRSIFLTRVVITLSAITAIFILYGIFWGKYDFQVRKTVVSHIDVPKGFHNMKILQISDLHTGSWDNKQAILKGIEKINQQEYDLLVFTGDFVNNLASEADPWTDVIASIKTPKYGKYAILGNHDYGEYINWNNEQEKQHNFEKIKSNIRKSGFQLLLNEHIPLVNKNDTIYLIGVENWGKNFKQVGDLKKATASIPEKSFKIVLSHDPSHWNAEIVGHRQQYQLTLSGHTHGMQLGIKIPNVIEWSPASWIYPEWGGLYQKYNQYIYVNRGFGFHAYSGRVGILPEITIIELKKQ